MGFEEDGGLVMKAHSGGASVEEMIREALETSTSVVHLARMLDAEHNVATEFYLKLSAARGPGESSGKRHLVAVSNDGRPVRSIPVPDSWSEDQLLDLVNGAIRPASSDDSKQ
jgi:hypothetical protein